MNEKQHDAEFIAKAREDIPRLLTEVERLREIALEILELYQCSESSVPKDLNWQVSEYRKYINGVGNTTFTEKELEIIKRWGFIASIESSLTEEETELYFKITDA